MEEKHFHILMLLICMGFAFTVASPIKYFFAFVAVLQVIVIQILKFNNKIK